MQCTAPQCGMCGGCGRDFPSTGGGRPPGNFYKYKLWKGHFWAILKTPEKKKAKKGFSQKLGKKGFCLKKRFPRESWITLPLSITSTPISTSVPSSNPSINHIHAITQSPNITSEWYWHPSNHHSTITEPPTTTSVYVPTICPSTTSAVPLSITPVPTPSPSNRHTSIITQFL